MPEPHVLILYNEPVLPLDHPDSDSEQEVLYSVGIVSASLKQMGINSTSVGVKSDPSHLIQVLREHPHDVVFNLFEGTADQGSSEAYFASVLEWLKIPFTGCTAHTITLARNKVVAKHLLKGAGIPTPSHLEIDSLDYQPCTLGWPVIVKPAREDASVGIDQGAVVTNEEQLRKRIEFVLQNYGAPALVEKFVFGREIHVSLIELDQSTVPTVLPFSEIRFKPDEKLWPIYSYDAKWKENCREFELRPVDVPVTLAPEITKRLSDVSREAYRVMGCRDLARIDFRVSETGEVYILEVNPNPSITSIMIETGLENIGWSYDRVIAHLVRKAHQRGGVINVNTYGKLA